MGAVTLGLDIGQRVDPTAICVAEEEPRRGDGRDEVHYLVRHLERLPLGTPYPAVAERVAAVVAGIVRQLMPPPTLPRDAVYVGVMPPLVQGPPPRPTLFVDATGVGLPVVDVLKAAHMPASIVPCWFTHGDRRSYADGEIHIGKAYLVSRLQTLLQTGRVHLPRTAEADALAAELLNYEIKVDEHANDKYGAFRVGTHDDLVTALGLAVQGDPRPRWRVFSAAAGGERITARYTPR